MRTPIFLLTGGLALIVTAFGVWWYLQPAQPFGAGGKAATSLPFQGPSSSTRTPQNTAVNAGSVNRSDTNTGGVTEQTPEQMHEEIAVRNSEPPLFETLPESAAEIDGYIQRQLRGPLENADAAQLITQDNIIDRSATVFVNLAKGQVVRNHLPIATPGGKFAVNNTDHAEIFTPSADNAQRYTPYVDAMEKFDTRTLAAFYKTLSPLLENAYRQLGEPGSFHDAMTTAFDLLLATPDIEDAQITLVRPKVMYQYQSPELEKLPPAQKMLLRMGNDNRARVKKVIAQWRAQFRP
jgi:hypothetical protein